MEKEIKFEKFSGCFGAECRKRFAVEGNKVRMVDIRERGEESVNMHVSIAAVVGISLSYDEVDRL